MIIFQNKENEQATQPEKDAKVDLQKCTEEEFWQEVKYSGNDSHSQR